MAVTYDDELEDETPIEDDSSEQTEAPRGTADQWHNWREANRRKDKSRTRDWAQKQIKKKLSAKNLGKTAAKQGAKQGVKRGTQAALSSTGVGAVAAVAIEAATNARIRKIAIWTVLGIIIAFILFFAKDDTLTTVNEEIIQQEQAAQGPSSGIVNLRKTGPSQVANGENITYTITATFTGSGNGILTDIIPDNTEFVSATGSCTGCEPKTRSVSWKLNQGANTISLTVKPTAENIVVMNTVKGGVSGSQTGGNCPSPDLINQNKRTPEACQYLNPGINIFDTSFTDEQLQKYISTYHPLSKRSLEDFTQKAQTIVKLAKEVGLNPVIPLGYWRTESNFGNGLGCPGVSNDFDSQVYCILGGPPNSTWTTRYSDAARCARDGDANSPACQFVAGRIAQHKTIYGPANVQVPIKKFDDLAEMIGSRSPDLENYLCATGNTDACANRENRNCTHTYNLLLEVANATNACVAGPIDSVDGGLAACTFTRGTDTRRYSSPLLLSYFQEVSQKTGVPAPVLAAVTKVESTTGNYNISDYTDADIQQMDNTSQIAGNIDNTISGTTKALCPRSPTGALGLMQLQPSEKVLNQIASANPRGTYNPNPGAHCDTCVDNGLRMARQAGYTSISSDADLTMQNYCDPRLSLYMGAGFILKKLQGLGIGNGQTWNPAWNTDPKVIEALVTSYYGRDSQTPLYVSSMIESLNSCQDNTPRTGPAPAPPADIRQGLIDRYNITMDGFSNAQLTAAWDLFWQVPNLANLTKGIKINAYTDPEGKGLSMYRTCTKNPQTTNIDLNPQTNIEAFRFTFTHELGHYIQECTLPYATFASEFQQAYTDEKEVSYYAQNVAACSGISNTDSSREDLAETLAFFVNPNVGNVNQCAPQVGARANNPFWGSQSNKYPQHLNVAKRVLGNYVAP